MKEMKTLNGYEIVDEKARNALENMGDTNGIPKPNGNGKILRSYNDEWCAVYPAMMAEGDTWWRAKNTAKTNIVTIQICEETPEFITTDTVSETWYADVDNIGIVTCYVVGNGLYICSSGGTPISANFNAKNMFSGFTNVTEIAGLGFLDTSETRDMANMFNVLQKLTTIDGVSSFNTSKATTMRLMFQAVACASLDLSGWDVSNVTDMGSMFNMCKELTTLNVSTWDVSNVTNMRQMLANCTQLTTIDVSNWNVGNVTNMEGTFYQDTALVSLDVSNWDVSNVENFNATFYRCSALTVLDVSNWNVGNVTVMSSMFSRCSALTVLDVSNWDVSNVETFNQTFYRCSALTVLDVSNWDVSNVTVMESMFSMSSGSGGGDASILKLDVSKWNTQSLTNAGWLFYGCGKITSLDLSNWNLNLVTLSSHMFTDCNSLTSIKFPASGTGRGFKQCTNLDSMFNDCKSIVSFDLNGLFENNTGKFEAVSQLFEGCISLTTIKGLSHLAGSPIKTIEQMFSGCENIPFIDISWLDTSTLAGGAFRPDIPDEIYSKMDDAFLNTHRLQFFKVGDKVTLDASCALPAPSAEYITGATGVWWDADTGVSYAPTEIPANKAATYTAVKSA